MKIYNTVTHAQRIEQSNSAAAAKGAWGYRHLDAWHHGELRFSGPLVTMIRGAADYADQHRERFESKIGDDGVLGPQWESIVKGIRGLLDGELGYLDGGTLDGLLCDMLREEGFDV